MGLVSSTEAIEQSKQLGLDIVGKYFVVALVRIELCDPSQAFDYHKYKLVEQIVAEFASNNLDVFLTKKDYEELVLLVKGDIQEQLIEESKFLLDLIAAEIKKQTDCNIEIVTGSVQDRLGSVHLSFLDALAEIKSFRAKQAQSPGTDQISLVRIDHNELEKFLKFGSLQDYETFFKRVILPVGEVALQSELMKQYLFVDLTLATNQFIGSLYANDQEASQVLGNLEDYLDEAASLEQIKLHTRKIIQSALEIRDEHVKPEQVRMLERISEYLENNYQNPDLQLSDAAEFCNLTPSYFSTVFHQQMGVTFREYLISRRLNRAKELLRTTNRKISEIALQSGYKDSHYFSHAFKKNTGYTPSQFREDPHLVEEE
jgi:two-component system response regulator YesN